MKIELLRSAMSELSLSFVNHVRSSCVSRDFQQQRKLLSRKCRSMFEWQRRKANNPLQLEICVSNETSDCVERKNVKIDRRKNSKALSVLVSWLLRGDVFQTFPTFHLIFSCALNPTGSFQVSLREQSEVQKWIQWLSFNPSRCEWCRGLRVNYREAKKAFKTWNEIVYHESGNVFSRIAKINFPSVLKLKDERRGEEKCFCKKFIRSDKPTRSVC